MASFKTYRLSRNCAGVVSWTAPDGETYTLDPSQAAGGAWFIPPTAIDASGKPTMAFKKAAAGGDGELVVSLDGADALAATLLSIEDDFPFQMYWATDGRNNNPLDRWAFILRKSGESGCPLRQCAGYRVLTVSGDFETQSHPLERDDAGIIHWSPPDDSNTFALDPTAAQPGNWLITRDARSRPVMALFKRLNQDAILVLSIDGAPGLDATLVRSGDRIPIRPYYATDDGANGNDLNPLDRPAFILRAEGREDCPIAERSRYKIRCGD